MKTYEIRRYPASEYGISDRLQVNCVKRCQIIWLLEINRVTSVVLWFAPVFFSGNPHFALIFAVLEIMPSEDIKII